MHIVIAGAGAVGRQIAQNLIDENKDIVLIDNDPERAKKTTETLDCQVVVGSASSVTNLLKAGIAKADFFISVTNSDEVNMIAAGIVSKLFETPKIIARIRNPEYNSNAAITDNLLKIDYVVNPEIEAAREIAEITAYGAFTHIVSFKKTNAHLVNMAIDSNSNFVNQTVKEIRSKIDKNFLIAAISRNDEILIPGGDTVIKEQDNIYIQTHDDDIHKYFDSTLQAKQKLHKILIVGGSRIATRLLSTLLTKKYSITVIEKDYEVCKKLSTDYPDALILNADITDENIYEEEHIDKYDLIICLTNNEELNLLTALYAKKIGTKRAIALVINNNYLKLSRHLGIDSVISSKGSSVDSILQYVRRGNISSVRTIFNGEAEVLEFRIEKGHSLCEMKLKEISLPQHSLILGINRDGFNFVPDGNLFFQPDDIVLVITKKKSVSKIENIFSAKQS